MPKKGEYVRFKNYERKMKLPFMIYTDFLIILVLEDNRRQNPGECFRNKHQNHGNLPERKFYFHLAVTCSNERHPRKHKTKALDFIGVLRTLSNI